VGLGLGACLLLIAGCRCSPRGLGTSCRCTIHDLN